MKPTVIVIRAIGVEFAKRALRPLVIVGAAIVAVLVGIGGWLTTINAWWWFLEAVLLMAAVLFVVLVAIVWTAIRVANPDQTKTQRQAVKRYVDTLQRVAENLQTPQLVILYRVVRDVIQPRQGGFIETVSRDSKSLSPDFIKLLDQFRQID